MASSRVNEYEGLHWSSDLSRSHIQPIFIPITPPWQNVQNERGAWISVFVLKPVSWGLFGTSVTLPVWWSQVIFCSYVGDIATMLYHASIVSQKWPSSTTFIPDLASCCWQSAGNIIYCSVWDLKLDNVTPDSECKRSPQRLPLVGSSLFTQH